MTRLCNVRVQPLYLNQSYPKISITTLDTPYTFAEQNIRLLWISVNSDSCKSVKQTKKSTLIEKKTRLPEK